MNFILFPLPNSDSESVNLNLNFHSHRNGNNFLRVEDKKFSLSQISPVYQTVTKLSWIKLMKRKKKKKYLLNRGNDTM